jgi:hypothetical protein
LLPDGDGAAAKGKRAKSDALAGGGESPRAETAANGTAAGSGSGGQASAQATTVRAQILVGQGLLQQDLRFVAAARKLGRGLQDG